MPRNALVFACILILSLYNPALQTRNIHESTPAMGETSQLCHHAESTDFHAQAVVYSLTHRLATRAPRGCRTLTASDPEVRTDSCFAQAQHEIDGRVHVASLASEWGKTSGRHTERGQRRGLSAKEHTSFVGAKGKGDAKGMFRWIRRWGDGLKGFCEAAVWLCVIASSAQHELWLGQIRKSRR